MGRIQVDEKIEGLKHVIKSWNVSVLGNIDTSIKKLEEELYKLDKCQDIGALSADEMKTKVKLRKETWEMCRREEALWRQKARINWIIDRNTSYIHTIANCRYRKNLIGHIKVEGD